MNEDWIREMVGRAEVEPLEQIGVGSYGTWRVIYHFHGAECEFCRETGKPILLLTSSQFSDLPR